MTEINCLPPAHTATHPPDVSAWAERFRHVAEPAGLFAPQPSVETPPGGGFRGPVRARKGARLRGVPERL